jgi:hypothetical protein
MFVTQLEILIRRMALFRSSLIPAHLLLRRALVPLEVLDLLGIYMLRHSIRLALKTESHTVMIEITIIRLIILVRHLHETGFDRIRMPTQSHQCLDGRRSGYGLDIPRVTVLELDQIFLDHLVAFLPAFRRDIGEHDPFAEPCYSGHCRRRIGCHRPR